MSDIWQGKGIWEGWRLTTDHSASSYGQPVLVSPTDQAYGPGDIVAFADIMSCPEAAELWSVTEDMIKRYARESKFHPAEARRAGKNWFVTKQGMYRLFGEPENG